MTSPLIRIPDQKELPFSKISFAYPCSVGIVSACHKWSMIDQRQLGVFLKRTRKQLLFASATVLLAAVWATIVAQTAQTSQAEAHQPGD